MDQKTYTLGGITATWYHEILQYICFMHMHRDMCIQYICPFVYAHLPNRVCHSIAQNVILAV